MLHQMRINGNTIINNNHLESIKFHYDKEDNEHEVTIITKSGETYQVKGAYKIIVCSEISPNLLKHLDTRLYLNLLSKLDQSVGFDCDHKIYTDKRMELQKHIEKIKKDIETERERLGKVKSKYFHKFIVIYDDLRPLVKFFYKNRLKKITSHHRTTNEKTIKMENEIEKLKNDFEKSFREDIRIDNPKYIELFNKIKNDLILKGWVE